MEAGWPDGLAPAPPEADEEAALSLAEEAELPEPPPEPQAEIIQAVSTTTAMRAIAFFLSWFTSARPFCFLCHALQRSGTLSL